MITIKLTNKLAYTLIAILTILTASLVVYAYTSIPNPGHGADTIKVTINGNEKTLQAAINDRDFGGVSVSSEVNCSTLEAAWKYCNLGLVSEWKACFLTMHDPITSGGSWDAGCKIDQSGGNWSLGVQAGASDGLTCAARCIK